MKIVRTIAELRQELATARSSGSRHVGLVPTMGALHEGHLSLVRAARRENDTVVLSIFVNPTQFTESADLSAYPRDEAHDVTLAEAAGVDVIFAPTVDEMYREGFATTVSVSGPLTETLEGAKRGSAHFDGVATVVVKLLLAALPERAYFGAKDAQQLLVVRRMVSDLGLLSEIVACPTSRDEDGLARSSRNARLSDVDRMRALAIPRALNEAERLVTEERERVAGALVDAISRLLVVAGIEPEYVACVDPETLAPLDQVDRPALFAIAARVGDVRLLDNLMLNVGELKT